MGATNLVGEFRFKFVKFMEPASSGDTHIILYIYKIIYIYIIIILIIIMILIIIINNIYILLNQSSLFYWYLL